MKKQLFCLGLAAAVTVTSQAMVLADWDFSAESGLTPKGPAVGSIMDSSKNTLAPNLTSSDLTGVGLIKFEDFNGAAGELNLREFNPNNATASGWFDFTLTANTGYKLNITDLDLSAYRNGGGAASTWNYLVSVDGGAFSQYGATKTPGTPGMFETHNFAGAINGADSVAFRFEGTNGSGNIHFNDIQVNGSVVPEPSSLALLGLGGLVLLRRRRK